jgi:hypothetical protein
MKSSSAALFGLQASLEVVGDAAPAHLPDEQLIAYARGRLDEVDRELAESHFEICQQCAVQAQELSALTALQAETLDGSSASTELRSPPARPWARIMVALSLPSLERHFLALPLKLRLAGAITILAVSVIAFSLWMLVKQDKQEIVDRPIVPSPTLSRPSDRPSPEPQKLNQAPILLALKDGNGQITLDAQGNFRGLESLSASDQQRVITALGTGIVQAPKSLEELRDSSGSFMGSSSKTQLMLLSPTGKVVVSDRPTFRWRPLGGAISYQVTITDPSAGYKEVAASPQLQDSKWTLDRPLKRGHIYTWQTIARTGDGEVKAPEAKFRTLEQAMADELAKVKKNYAGRRLVMGLLYAEAGLLDEAENELKALLAANPQSPVVKSLLQDIQSKQRGK